MPLPTRVQSIVDDSCSHLNQLFTFGHGKFTSVQFLLFHRIDIGDCLFKSGFGHVVSVGWLHMVCW